MILFYRFAICVEACFVLPFYVIRHLMIQLWGAVFDTYLEFWVMWGDLLYTLREVPDAIEKGKRK